MSLDETVSILMTLSSLHPPFKPVLGYTQLLLIQVSIQFYLFSIILLQDYVYKAGAWCLSIFDRQMSERQNLKSDGPALI